MRSMHNVSEMSSFVDWYDVLGIPDTASNNDIKKAYRKMALRWHPEKNPANQPEALKRYTDISHAYEVLSNASNRESFDRQRFSLQTPTSGGHDDPRFTFRDPLTGGTCRDVASLSGSTRDQNGGPDRRPGPRGPAVTFRDPNDVFREFFGGREPFIEAFSSNTGAMESARCTGIPHEFDQTLPGFVVGGPGPGATGGLTGGFYPCSSVNGAEQRSAPFASSANGGAGSPTAGGGSGSIRHVTTSTRLHNGRKVVTKRIVDNGVETVTVEEDGKLVSKSVNGQPVPLPTSDQSSSSPKQPPSPSTIDPAMALNLYPQTQIKPTHVNGAENANGKPVQEIVLTKQDPLTEFSQLSLAAAQTKHGRTQ